MQTVRYWFCVHITPTGPDYTKRREPFLWHCTGWAPSVTGIASAQIVCGVIDAPGVLEVEEAVRDRFGKTAVFAFVSPKPGGWLPRDFPIGGWPGRPAPARHDVHAAP